jgi:hypothetical protein
MKANQYYVNAHHFGETPDRKVSNLMNIKLEINKKIGLGGIQLTACLWLFRHSDKSMSLHIDHPTGLSSLIINGSTPDWRLQLSVSGSLPLEGYQDARFNVLALDEVIIIELTAAGKTEKAKRLSLLEYRKKYQDIPDKA